MPDTAALSVKKALYQRSSLLAKVPDRANQVERKHRYPSIFQLTAVRVSRRRVQLVTTTVVLK